MTTTDRTTETKGLGRYAEVNGINLYFETMGTGRPLILLHGGLGRARCSGRLSPRSRNTTRSSRSTSRGTAARRHDRRSTSG